MLSYNKACVIEFIIDSFWGSE